MEGKTLGIIVVVIIVIAGGWYLLKGTPASAPASTTETQTPAPSGPATSGVTVTYTDEGFSPASVTVSLGTTVTFINQSSGDMWVASAMHPTHSVYSGTSLSQHCPSTTNDAFDECRAEAPGSLYSFTFAKEGTWKYHDHLDATKFGSVVVTASTTP